MPIDEGARMTADKTDAAAEAYPAPRWGNGPSSFLPVARKIEVDIATKHNIRLQHA